MLGAEVGSVSDQQSGPLESADVVLGPVVAFIGHRLQHPDGAERAAFFGMKYLTPRRVEEHDADVRLPADSVVESHFVNSTPSQGANALVAQIDEDPSRVGVAFVPKPQLERLTADFEAVPCPRPIAPCGLRP